MDLDKANQILDKILKVFWILGIISISFWIGWFIGWFIN